MEGGCGQRHQDAALAETFIDGDRLVGRYDQPLRRAAWAIALGVASSIRLSISRDFEISQF